MAAYDKKLGKRMLSKHTYHPHIDGNVFEWIMAKAAETRKEIARSRETVPIPVLGRKL